MHRSGPHTVYISDQFLAFFPRHQVLILAGALDLNLRVLSLMKICLVLFRRLIYSTFVLLLLAISTITQA
jgi:hypothetical protein